MRELRNVKVREKQPIENKKLEILTWHNGGNGQRNAQEEEAPAEQMKEFFWLRIRGLEGMKDSQGGIQVQDIGGETDFPL